MKYDEGCMARLEEIKFEMLELLGEAEELVKGTSEEDRAEAYWLSHIKGALTNGSGIVGGSMYTMEDAIEGIRINDMGALEEDINQVEA